MKHSEVNDEVNKTLASLEGLEPADPGPYFYSRLRARMTNQETTVTWVWKLALAVLILINVFTFVITDQTNDSQTLDPMTQLSESYFGNANDFSDLAYNE